MPTQPLGVTFLIDCYQDVLYEVRDYCRGMILAGTESCEDVAQWMQAQYAERFATDGFESLTRDDWLDLAESCLADTQEVMGYEEANELSVGP